MPRNAQPDAPDSWRRFLPPLGIAAGLLVWAGGWWQLYQVEPPHLSGDDAFIAHMLAASLAAGWVMALIWICFCGYRAARWFDECVDRASSTWAIVARLITILLAVIGLGVLYWKVASSSRTGNPESAFGSCVYLPTLAVAIGAAFLWLPFWFVDLATPLRRTEM